MPESMPRPPRDPDSDGFYAAADEGRFLVPRCARCARRHWYPRPICPFCGGEARLEPASGRGVVYSASVVRRADPPFAIAYVTLDEGPSMLTHVVDCDFDAVAIGMPVEIVFRRAEGGVAVPCFRPRAA